MSKKNELIALIGSSVEVDALGQQKLVGRDEVYAEVTSVSSKEYVTLGTTNVKAPAGSHVVKEMLRVVVFRCEYNGQRKVEYNGVTYTVYRTYLKGKDIELYVEVRADD